MVPPAHSGLVLLAVTLVMLVLSWVSVLLRVFVRRRAGAIGLGDWLMALGLIFFTIVSALIILTCFYGAGYMSKALSSEDISLGTKYSYIAELIYTVARLLIKCSICVTMIFTVAGPYRPFVWALYTIVGLAALNCVIFFVSLIKLCSPISAMWDPDAGTCDHGVNVAIPYLFSIISIVTDWSLATAPVLMVWGKRMEKKKCCWTAIIQALALLVCCANIVRLRYSLRYNDTTEYMLAVGKVAVWSMLELGIAILAGSLPMLSPVLNRITQRCGKLPPPKRYSAMPWLLTEPFRTITTIEANHDHGCAPSGECHILKETRFSMRSDHIGPEVPANVVLRHNTRS